MNFNQECATGDWMSRMISSENPQRRDDQLSRLFRALRERLKHPESSVETSLAIRNLQIVAFYPDTLGHFRHLTHTLEHLELLITEKSNHFDGSDTFLYPETRHKFMMHLETIWLRPLSPYLRSLSLSFHFYRGALPSLFDGSDLIFPQLQSLTLKK